MKQSITKEQWDELSDKQKVKLSIYFHNDRNEYHYEDGNDLTIGQMIEYLGEDLANISNELTGWFISLFPPKDEPNRTYSFEKPNLCDALWEAVKYKLK